METANIVDFFSLRRDHGCADGFIESRSVAIDSS